MDDPHRCSRVSCSVAADPSTLANPKSWATVPQGRKDHSLPQGRNRPMVAGTVAKGWPRNYGVLQGHPEPATNQTTEALLRVFDRCFRVALAVLGAHVATSDRAPVTALLRARLLARTLPCHVLTSPPSRCGVRSAHRSNTTQNTTYRGATRRKPPHLVSSDVKLEGQTRANPLHHRNHTHPKATTATRTTSDRGRKLHQHRKSQPHTSWFHRRDARPRLGGKPPCTRINNTHRPLAHAQSPAHPYQPPTNVPS